MPKIPSFNIPDYNWIKQIGSGGFGTVWMIRHQHITNTYSAIKLIPSHNVAAMEMELKALKNYQSIARRVQGHNLFPVEHIGYAGEGVSRHLYYIMPLADGLSKEIPPEDSNWKPKTLASLIEQQRTQVQWFSSEYIIETFIPVTKAVKALNKAGMMHQDVKPENIIFIEGESCLADFSLLRDDAIRQTRHGTPGFAAPTYYVETGGQPDMWGLAATLYSFLTGNPPDCIARANYRWVPQGESSLSPEERDEWLRIHRVIYKATNENPQERYVRIEGMVLDLQEKDKSQPPSKGNLSLDDVKNTFNELKDKATTLVSNIPVEKYKDKIEDLKTDIHDALKRIPLSAPREKYDDLKNHFIKRKDYVCAINALNHHIKSKAHTTVIESIDGIFEQFPNSLLDESLYIQKANALIALGRYRESTEVFLSYPKASGKSTSVKFRKLIFESIKQWESSIAELPPDKATPWNYYTSASRRIKIKNYSGALDYLQRAIDCHLPTDPARSSALAVAIKIIESDPEFSRYVHERLGVSGLSETETAKINSDVMNTRNQGLSHTRDTLD